MLLFLHADTSLPPAYDRTVAKTLARPGVAAGAFGLAIDSPRRALRMIAWAANQRSRWLGLPYGDQAIFLSAGLFRKLGGFADLPVMEDFELIRRVRRHGRVAIADGFATTAARRWVRHGLWRTTFTHQLTIAAYYLGVSPARMAQWRNQIPPSSTESDKPRRPVLPSLAGPIEAPTPLSPHHRTNRD
jgi:hypothetical protein